MTHGLVVEPRLLQASTLGALSTHTHIHFYQMLLLFHFNLLLLSMFMDNKYNQCHNDAVQDHLGTQLSCGDFSIAILLS